jgi:hypothetical protein
MRKAMTGFIIKLVPDEAMAAVLGDIVKRLAELKELLMTEQEAVTALAAEVSAQGTVIESAMALIDGLVKTIEGASDVSPQILAVLGEVKAQREALAASVLENTPAQPGDGATPAA